MSKNLERLKSVDFKPLNPYDIKLLKRVLEDFEKRIKQLEQAQTYFPIEYPNQTGGVDNIKIGLGDPD